MFFELLLNARSFPLEVTVAGGVSQFRSIRALGLPGNRVKHGLELHQFTTQPQLLYHRARSHTRSAFRRAAHDHIEPGRSAARHRQPWRQNTARTRHVVHCHSPPPKLGVGESRFWVQRLNGNVQSLATGEFSPFAGHIKPPLTQRISAEVSKVLRPSRRTGGQRHPDIWPTFRAINPLRNRLSAVYSTGATHVTPRGFTTASSCSQNV